MFFPFSRFLISFVTSYVWHLSCLPTTAFPHFLIFSLICFLNFYLFRRIMYGTLCLPTTFLLFSFSYFLIKFVTHYVGASPVLKSLLESRQYTNKRWNFGLGYTIITKISLIVLWRNLQKFQINQWVRVKWWKVSPSNLQSSNTFGFVNKRKISRVIQCTNAKNIQEGFFFQTF